MSNGKTVSDKDKLKLSGKKLSDKDKKSLKSRIASINRGVVSPKYIAKEFKAQHGLSTGKFDLNKSLISRAYSLARGVISPGKAVSEKDFMNALKKIRDAKKKGKPHLKKGGKAK